MPSGTRAPSRPNGGPSNHNGAPRSLTYADAGVNLDEKDRFTESLESIMRRTHGPRVIPNPGGFAGLFRLDYKQRLFRRNYREPVLVACTDGCGTKVKLAGQLGMFDTIGIDLVAMNVNDMIVQGAEPLLFLDYIAVGKVDSRMLTDIVRGVAEGCRIAGCALLGGETAEMPDVYAAGDFDLAGFAVGVVELKRAVNPTRVRVGDVVLGLESDGIHSNGYTLVRKVVQAAGLDLNAVYPEIADLGYGIGDRKRRRKAAAPSTDSRSSTIPPHPEIADMGYGIGDRKRRRGAAPIPNPKSAPPQPTLGRILLTPTRIYAPSIVKLLRGYKVKNVISGMAHITGSGMAGNLERALHKSVDAAIDTSSWPVPPVLRFLQDHGGIPDAEMRRVFNMGIGYTLIVRPAFADSIAEQLEKLGERVHVIGKIVKGTGRVREEQAAQA